MSAATAAPRSGSLTRSFMKVAKKTAEIAIKGAILGGAIWAGATLFEYSFLHGGTGEAKIVSELAQGFFKPIFEVTGILGWADGFNIEPWKDGLRSVHEFFGLQGTFPKPTMAIPDMPSNFWDGAASAITDMAPK